MARLDLSLLGPLDVSLAGEPVTAFVSNKVRALLAYLAVEADRPHRRDTLAALLWPDWPDRSARTNLRNALANLRHCVQDRAANPPHLIASRETIQFNADSDHWLDVAAFRALVEADSPDGEWLEEAVALYRGPFLQGFSIGDSPAFEAWARLQGEHLRRQFLDALSQLAEGYLERGEPDKALDRAQRQLALDPARESALRQALREVLLVLHHQDVGRLSLHGSSPPRRLPPDRVRVAVPRPDRG